MWAFAEKYHMSSSEWLYRNVDKTEEPAKQELSAVRRVLADLQPRRATCVSFSPLWGRGIAQASY